MGLALLAGAAFLGLVTSFGGFLAAVLFFGAADFLGEDLHGAWTFVTLLLVGPLAIAGTCLVALRCYPTLGLVQE